MTDKKVQEIYSEYGEFNLPDRKQCIKVDYYNNFAMSYDAYLELRERKENSIINRLRELGV